VLLAAAPTAGFHPTALNLPRGCTRDLNPLVDQGCPLSVGGVDSAGALACRIGIPFQLLPLDIVPFYHGFGEKCSDARPTGARWRRLIENLAGTDAYVEFYMVPGSGPLLLGSFLLRCAVVDGPEGLIEFTADNGQHVVTPTYHDGVRTRLAVVPMRIDKIRQTEEARSTFLSTVPSPPSTRAQAERLASRLHSSSHLAVDDLEKMCRRAGVWSQQLSHYLKLAAASCESCLRTVRPQIARKISLSRVSREFNTHVQVDVFYMDFVDPRPVLHAIDTATGFFVTSLSQTKDLETLAKLFERDWIRVHGPPNEVSDDQEFAKSYFQRMLTRHAVVFKERPARRHNTSGIVERGNAIVKMFVKRLILDAEAQGHREF
jgi:hypothetical protein